MSISARSSHAVKLGFIILLLTTSSYYLFFEKRYDIQDVYRVAKVVTEQKVTAVQGLLHHDTEAPVDTTALATLCTTKNWTPGLIFHCEPPEGGVANIRNVFLNCVRYAIEAGATGFIVPEITVRGASPGAPAGPHTTRQVPFGNLFDQEHFTTSLQNACPQMTIYAHRNDLWDKPTTSKPVVIKHPQLTSPRLFAAPSVIDPKNWTKAFTTHLNTTHFSFQTPLLVTLQNTLLTWPLSHDPPPFTATFGSLIRLSPPIQHLGTTILAALTTKHHLSLAPSILPHSFYGAHLRSAPDALRAGWTPPDIQTSNYLAHAAASALKLIYLSSDSAIDAFAFRIAANATLGIVVEDAESLLPRGGKGLASGEAAELSEWRGLSAEQKLGVDWVVLRRASVFGGTWESSFSWALAMGRRAAGGAWAEVEVGGIRAGGTRGTPETRGPGRVSTATGWIRATPTLESQGPRVTSELGAAEEPHISTPASTDPANSAAEATPAEPTDAGDSQAATEEAAHIPTPTPADPADPVVEATPAEPTDAGDAQAATEEAAQAASSPTEDTPSEESPDRETEATPEVENEDVGMRQPVDVEKREEGTTRQAFEDKLSTIFGNVTLWEHPGAVFALALWP